MTITEWKTLLEAIMMTQRLENHSDRIDMDNLAKDVYFASQKEIMKTQIEANKRFRGELMELQKQKNKVLSNQKQFYLNQIKELKNPRGNP